MLGALCPECGEDGGEHRAGCSRPMELRAPAPTSTEAHVGRLANRIGKLEKELAEKNERLGEYAHTVRLLEALVRDLKSKLAEK